MPDKNPLDLDELISLGARYADQNNSDGIIEVCRKILKSYPQKLEYRQVLVHSLFSKEDFEGTLRELQPLLKSNFEIGWSNIFLGLAYSKLGQHEKALNAFNTSLEAEKTFDALLNRGNTLKHLSRLDDASQDYRAALEINGESQEAWNNLGVVFMEQSNFSSAIRYFDQALKLSPTYMDALLNKGNALLGLKEFERALKIYQELSCTSQGVPKVWLNFSFYFSETGDLESALHCLDRALGLDPNYSKAWFNRGAILERSGQSKEAERSYSRASELNPDYDFIDGEILHSRMTNCNWSNFDETLSKIKKRISEGRPVSSPFPILASIDDPAIQLLVAKKWVQSKYSSVRLAKGKSNKRTSGRLKVGYFSADFHNHATAFLISELIESHDRSKFEIFAFSYGPELNDEMRTRLKYAFEHFIDVRLFSDDQISDICKDRGLNIAIDLKGFTQDGRPSIFTRDLADVHINFLGYPGTLGSTNYDYIVADHVLIPKHLQHYYQEKIIYMPVSYQCNDSQRIFPGVTCSREEFGLRDQDFVMCCFNNSYKITPSIFDTWLRILKTESTAVLWLLSDSQEVKENLWLRAQSRGVDSKRIVFTERATLARHLARYRLADIFLDTFPYGAHTTASEALWMGLPLVTLRGRTFASAVGASLLSALGLHDLITASVDNYEARVSELLHNTDDLAMIRGKLAKCRASALFSGQRFARDFECALITAYSRAAAGLDALSFEV